jgi:Na+-driven multidrug efflux pump
MIKEILRLAIPLAVVQVGASFLGVIDTAVVGRTSAEELAAVGLGN